MYFNNTNLIIYHNDDMFIINGLEILDIFNCELINSNNKYNKYKIHDEIYIDSINNFLKFNKTRIEYIYTSNLNVDMLNLYYNNNVSYISNILCFNLKDKKIFNTNNINKKFILKNVNNYNFNEYKINPKFGYISGYWLLRGGFTKVDNNYHISITGKPEHIKIIKSLYNDDFCFMKKEENIMIIINNEFYDFIKNNFTITSNKFIPNWIYRANTEFIKNFVYGLIAGNSYISKDDKDNYYLIIKIIKEKALSIISKLLEYRLNFYSRTILPNNYLSLKINKSLYEFLKDGIMNNLIFINEFDKINPIMNKEIFYEKFKIVPWYKFNFNNINIKDSFSLELNKNNYYMIQSGFFVK